MSNQLVNKKNTEKIKVLIVDDSALIRALLTEIINQADDMEVIATARDPLIAREKIRELQPDVITLDIEMPNMDGLEFLEKLMRLHPLPVLMISTHTLEGSAATLRALELGAVDFIAKPKVDIQNKLETYADEITEKIRVAAQANIRPLHGSSTSKPLAKATNISPVLTKKKSERAKPSKQKQPLIVIGASTGGTEAIKEILIEMPADCPPILVVQHMPEGFTKSYAARLNSLCEIAVNEAVHGEPLRAGHAYLAPGGFHLTIVRSGGQYLCQISDDALVNHHRPSVDVLFNSVAKVSKNNALGIILTGMGKDGAAGLKVLHDLGCKTFAQDEKSCVVFGMPKEAIARGAVDIVAPIDEIANQVLAHLGYALED
jgi:two-component system, chemotaxis family, protein-glutamate methylesterase/glutaminase